MSKIDNMMGDRPKLAPVPGRHRIGDQADDYTGVPAVGIRLSPRAKQAVRLHPWMFFLLGVLTGMYLSIFAIFIGTLLRHGN